MDVCTFRAEIFGEKVQVQKSKFFANFAARVKEEGAW
jgi:hypothetical protein